MFQKIVLFKGGVETLGFFSEQIEKTLVDMGYEVFMFDYDKEASSSYNLLRFVQRGNTMMLTFNFHGICNEALLRDEDGIYIWEQLKMPCYNIVVDHPFYYDRFMGQLPKYYYQISIDRNHIDFLKRFYPQIRSGLFVPLGGTELDWEEDEMLPIREREYDLIITGSWAEPEFFGDFMKKDGPEYEVFYRSILDELIQHPEKTFEEVLEPKLFAETEEGDSITDDDLRLLYARMVQFDMYIRYYFRGELVKNLVDNGLKVYCIGGGWDKLKCNHPENIIYEEYSPSIDCLRAIRNSKISINVMPWFKRGAHDRIFNTMLNGAVSFTDSSEYLDEFLIDGKNCLIYSLDRINEAAEIIKRYIDDDEALQKIADEGYRLAKKNHTWDARARQMMEFIKEDYWDLT